MKDLHFRVSTEVEEGTGSILAVYFQIRKGQAFKVKEFADGRAFANYDVKGKLLGVELLGPCEITVLDQIARKEPRAKSFIRKSIPREMALV